MDCSFEAMFYIVSFFPFALVCLLVKAKRSESRSVLGNRRNLPLLNPPPQNAPQLLGTVW